LSPSALYLQQLFKNHTKLKQSEHRRRQHVVQRLGIATSKNRLEIPNLPEYQFPRDPQGFEYPPRDCYILESYSTSDRNPSRPKRKDKICAYRSKFHRLNESKLSHQLEATELDIYRDSDTGEIVCIVIRDFAKDYFSVLQEWRVALVKDSINHRRPCQHNTPQGQLVQIGVSEGSRSATLFGWVQNLFFLKA